MSPKDLRDLARSFTPGGMSVLLVVADTRGYTVLKDIPKLGYKGTESGELLFENCQVPVENLVGGVEGRGMQQVLGGLETGRSTSGRARARRRAGGVRRGPEVQQGAGGFGQPISDFQPIQLKLAQMATQIQAARLLLYWAVSEADKAQRADMQSGMAKLFASEVCADVTLDAMRIHGGYGYSKEFVVERLYRDAPLMLIGEAPTTSCAP